MIGVVFKGRLGNNMYQYAYIRSVSERKNIDFCINNPNTEFDSIFPHLKIYDKNCNIYNREILRGGQFSEHFYDLNDNILADGFFQHHRYFENCKVKEWFKIHLNEQEQLSYEEIISKYEPSNYCYIYFRGTDFNNIKQYYVPPEWYKNAKDEIDGDKFIVITDDIETAKKFIDADDYISTNYKIDFNLLTSANKLIIPVMSSFGWWGAWLSDAITIITPKNNDDCWIVNDRFVYL